MYLCTCMYTKQAWGCVHSIQGKVHFVSHLLIASSFPPLYIRSVSCIASQRLLYRSSSHQELIHATTDDQMLIETAIFATVKGKKDGGEVKREARLTRDRKGKEQKALCVGKRAPKQRKRFKESIRRFENDHVKRIDHHPITLHHLSWPFEFHFNWE